MNNKGIYNKENVGKGVFIFTESNYFISPEFWGLYKETEKPVGVAILGDRKLLVALNEFDGSLELLARDKGLKSKIYGSWDEAVTDDQGKETTLELAAMGSAAATFCNEYACGQVEKGNWYFSTLADIVFMYNHKQELDIALGICGGKMMETDDFFWTSTRVSEGCHCIFDWFNGNRLSSNQNGDFRVRPVSDFLQTL